MTFKAVGVVFQFKSKTKCSGRTPDLVFAANIHTSVRPSVRPSVRTFVRPSLPLSLEEELIPQQRQGVNLGYGDTLWVSLLYARGILWSSLEDIPGHTLA